MCWIYTIFAAPIGTGDKKSRSGWRKTKKQHMETLKVPIASELKKELFCGLEICETLATDIVLPGTRKAKTFGWVDFWKIRRARKFQNPGRYRSL